MKVFRISLYLSIVLTLSGCSTVGYYTQSVVGHSRLMLARQPLDKAIANSTGELKTQLDFAKQIRQFAVDELELPDNRSYKNYVALKREYPVWTIVAAPEFSLEAKQWCYLVIGCAAYRGYFKKAAAQKYADKLKDQGLEVTVGGASAYSTLGYFADPLLPSMLNQGKANFAEVVFHELAHQQLYINGDSGFNEAFASIVGEVGAQLWLESSNDQQTLTRYKAGLQASIDFEDLLAQTRDALNKVYEANVDDDEKRANKQRVFDELKADYQQLKNGKWNGTDWYGRWFAKPINNARLAAFSTYRNRIPELKALFADCDNSFSRFYASLEAQASFDKAAGQVVVPKSCVEIAKNELE